MKYLQAITKISAALMLFVGLTTSVYSQKLNKVQQGSVWAPANIKVDAKLKEWDDTFQAYNKVTEIYYTVANDDKNLYLVLKSTDPINNNKIIAGGINFTINTTGAEKEKGAYVVIFPLVDMTAMRANIMNMRTSGGGGNNGEPDSAAIANMRRQAIKNVKEIKLKGFDTNDVPDTVVSIYNELGIKGAMDYDVKGNLTCEMAIPLKYLHLTKADNKEFAYNIKLNGLDINAIFPGMGAMMSGAMAGGGGAGGFGGGGGGGGFGGGRGGGGGGGAAMAAAGSNGIPTNMLQMQTLISPTDFWGKYTLAKK